MWYFDGELLKTEANNKCLDVNTGDGNLYMYNCHSVAPAGGSCFQMSLQVAYFLVVMQKILIYCYVAWSPRDADAYLPLCGRAVCAETSILLQQPFNILQIDRKYVRSRCRDSKISKQMNEQAVPQMFQLQCSAHSRHVWCI